MIPKLFESFNTSAAIFDGKFLGSISHCTSCLVTETTSGEYTLELETTVNDPTAGLLLSQRIIAAKPNPTDPIQYFEIQSTERNLSGLIKVSAKHVKNFACQLVSEGDVQQTDRVITYRLTPQEVWDRLFADAYIPESTPFTFYSDVTAKADFFLGFNNPKTLGAILGGEEGSMMDMYSGEFHYDNYNIQFLKNRGKASAYRLRYGQNISTAVQKEDCLQTYSHILPYASVSRSDGKYIYLFSPLYAIPNHESQRTKVLILDCTEAVTDYQVGTTGQHFDEVKAAMTAHAAHYAQSNNIGKISVSIAVTTPAELDAMKQLGLCDTVKVVLDNFGIETTAKITSVTYDTLLERWSKMIVGESSVSLTDIILNKRGLNL